MKKRYLWLIVAFAVLIAAVSVCEAIRINGTPDNGGQNTPPPDTSIKESAVTVTASNISLNEDGEIDVLSLFKITEDGKSIEVTLDMLELGELDPEKLTEGEYTVTLTYKSADGKTHTASSTVKVSPKYTVTVKIAHTDMRILSDEALDISQLFSVKADGENVAVTTDMLDLGGYDTASPKIGTYTVTLTYISQDGVTHTDTAVLTVIKRADVEIKGSSVTVYEGAEIDILSLFTLTENGESVAVTFDMLDTGRLDPDNTVAGDYTVTLTYTSNDGCRHTGTAAVHVIRQWIGPF